MDIKYIMKTSIFYYFYICIKLAYIKRQKMKMLLAEAKMCFSKEKPKKGCWADYKNAMKKHFVTYSEYMYQYEFWNLSEEERNQFISRNELIFLMTRKSYISHFKNEKLYSPSIFSNKVNFLRVYSKFIHRKWICAQYVSFDLFCDFINANEGKCIIKPLNGNCGKGVSLVTSSDNLLDIYNYCCDNNMLIEECIEGCKEIQEFHPESLNTIRVVTIIDKKSNILIFGSFLRMGVGNHFIDNAHAGGIFAQIDIETGIVETDGFDTNGNVFIEHCDTYKKIKGFVIPMWNEIKETCIVASRMVKDAGVIIGWDVVINKNNEIEFVEANYCPDFDLMQSPLKVGCKKRLLSYIK